jgi:hypothetical protein
MLSTSIFTEHSIVNGIKNSKQRDKVRSELKRRPKLPQPKIFHNGKIKEMSV